MNAFAALLTALERARSTGRKLELLTAYFREARRRGCGWALHLLTGRRPQRIASGPELRRWLGEAAGLSEAVLEATYAHVGDLAETLALVLPAPPLGTTVPATSLQALLEEKPLLPCVEAAAKHGRAPSSPCGAPTRRARAFGSTSSSPGAARRRGGRTNAPGPGPSALVWTPQSFNTAG